VNTEGLDALLARLAALENRVSELESRLYSEQCTRGSDDDRLERLLTDETRNREYDRSDLERKIDNVERSSRGRY
jgi:hypothetical protein